MKNNSVLFIILGFLFLLFLGFTTFSLKKVKSRSKSKISVGNKIDSLNGVFVYFNGNVSNVSGRNTSPDGYNIGLKYQCVEFVKRYYYQHINHTMPDSYGHAKDFFNKSIADGKQNKQRNLIQYSNPSRSKPRVDDLLILGGTRFNSYGHVAIISKVTDTRIEIIQQNVGRYGKTRQTYPLVYKEGKWEIKSNSILGWLRKE
ncbi:MAG: CHAP domain-containing protein [Cyclobacteriaceae bacterium]|nr:CHAP domain-containing protein [Cyclobacteriaceae bacterium]